MKRSDHYYIMKLMWMKVIGTAKTIGEELTRVESVSGKDLTLSSL